MKKSAKYSLIIALACGCLGIGIVVGKGFEENEATQVVAEVNEKKDNGEDIVPVSTENTVSIKEPEGSDPYEKNKISTAKLEEEYKASLQEEEKQKKAEEEESKAQVQEYCSDKNSYLFEQSSTDKLTIYDYAYLNTEAIKLARNEIYARHGYIFEDKYYQDIFSQKSWYKPSVKEASAIKLSEVENYNVLCLKWWEKVNHEAWQQSLEKGFNDCYQFNANQTFTMDLNNDGIQEEISCKNIMQDEDYASSASIEINGRVQDTLEGNFQPNIWVVDVDPNDDYKELVIYDQGPSSDPVDTYYYYDGKKLIKMGSVEGHLNDDDYIEGNTLHAVKRFDILGTTRYRWNYELTEEHTWKEVPCKWMDATIPVIAQQAINIYSDANIDSSKRSFKAGTSFETIGTDLEEWIEVKLEDGSKGWINIIEYPTYELGGLFFAD